MTSKVQSADRENFGTRIERQSREGESRGGQKKNITYSPNNQLPDGLIARLVEHCIGTSVVKI